MARKLIPLSFTPSTELPDLDELKAFLTTEFGRQVPGFNMLDANAKWGELTLDLVGVDGTGRLVTVFPAVSRQERAFHEVISQAVIATAWVEDHADELTQAYGDRGAKPDEPLRLILVAPSLPTGSRSLARALERSGVEVMPYSIFEIDTGEGKLLALSFDGSAAPASAPSRPAAAARSREPAPAGDLRVETPEPARESDTMRDVIAPTPEAPPVAVVPPPEASRPPSAVEIFVSSLADQNLKAMSEQILTFLMSRFPSAEGVVSPQEKGFTLAVASQHLATIRLDKTALWLEVGPERIPTNKIKDPATLERAMNLPSVLDALGSVHGV